MTRRLLVVFALTGGWLLSGCVVNPQPLDPFGGNSADDRGPTIDDPGASGGAESDGTGGAGTGGSDVTVNPPTVTGGSAPGGPPQAEGGAGGGGAGGAGGGGADR